MKLNIFSKNYSKIWVVISVFFVCILSIFSYKFLAAYFSYQEYLYEKKMCLPLAGILNNEVTMAADIRYEKGIYLLIRDTHYRKNYPEVHYYLQNPDSFDVYMFEGGFVVKPTLRRYSEIRKLWPRSQYALKILIDKIDSILENTSLTADYNSDDFANILTLFKTAQLIYGKNNSELIRMQNKLLSYLDKEEQDNRNMLTKNDLDPYLQLLPSKAALKYIPKARKMILD